MSYDIYLYKDKKDPSKVEDFEQLKEKYDVSIDEISESKEVEVFSLSPKGSKDTLAIFEWSDDCYASFFSYSASKEDFSNFFDVVDEIAESLGCKIMDPQITDKKITPEEHRSYRPRLKKVVDTTKSVTKGVMGKLGVDPAILFFTLYLITTTDPKSGEQRLLTLEDDTFYCGKFCYGEEFAEVVGEDVEKLTGQKEFTIVNVIDGDMASDKFGKIHQRKNVVVEVPYFNPKKSGSKIKTKWSDWPAN